MYKTGIPLDQIICQLTEEMHKSRDRLDKMAAKLHTITKDEPHLNSEVMRFLDGLRIMDTGTLIYSYVRTRNIPGSRTRSFLDANTLGRTG